MFGSHAGGRDNVIRNNLIYANFPLGIDGGIGGVAMTNTHIVNNTVVGNIIGINVSGGDMGVIRNTIMANNHPAVVQQWLQANRPNLLSTVNVNRHGAGSNVNVSDGYQQDHNLIGTDPKLANFTRNDLRLTVGSPAIDAGSSQGAPPTDFEGTPRPQGAGWDIGADEYGGGGPPTCTPAAETCDQKDNDCDGEVDEGNVCQPQGAWTFCANEGGQCSFSGTKEVRYGANGAYFYKTLTNGTACTNAVFGDPAFGITKQCHYRGTVGSGDTTPPTVTLTAPAANTTVSGTVTISATASDNVGVSKIEFLVDGVVKGTDTSSPYSFSWDTTNGGAHPCNGPHTHVLSAKASDAANNIKTSSSVVVNMNNPPHCTHPDTTSPQVTAFSATPGSTRMTWGVQDTGGSHLKRIEVWRAPYEDDGNPDCDEQNKDHCAWTELTNVRVTLTSQNIDTHTIPASNPVIDDPAPGTWWYGIHAVDQAGNCTTEANKDCTTGASNGLDPQGPDKVVTSAPACTPSSWQNQGCGQGGCPQNQMRQTKTFTPSGCAADEGRCITDSQCQPACIPTQEVCDQKDNDCDGQIDNGNVCQPAPSCPTTIPNNAFTACYFDNQDLTNFKLSRTDQKIDFTWAKGSPDPALSPDTFSSRWQGKFSFDAGSHTFSVTTDDGFRLYLDNVLILDQWRDQGATTHTTVTKTLTQGQHTIKAEYYENGGDAVAKLSWQKGSQAPPAGSSDLVPQDIWWSPDPAKRGNDITIGFRVRNNGAGTAGPFHVIIKRDGTGICDWDVPGLGAGESFERGPGVGYGGSCSGRYGIEDAQPPGYDITFMVDDRSQVGETDEGNNERRERVTVGQ